MIDRDTFHWPGGQRCAVSLTYDDALACHYDIAAPQLESAGLRGTFNVTVNGHFMESTERWAMLAARGHELGNHSLFHPCYSAPPQIHTWLDAGYNLKDYTEKRFREEIRLANWILHRVDGKTERTYAKTCCDNWIGEGSARQCIEPILADYVIAARGEWTGKAVDLDHINYYNLGLEGTDGRSFETIRDKIEALAETGGWIIYVAHGVGAGTHDLFTDLEVHRRLVEWLGANKARVWTAPMIDVVKHLKAFEC
ncbi:MAG: polysaccharide deacetylase family protein [Anaerolineae bacterium]|nr:polysaccharide deacetylase family protein [Anaerolineae bacterium]